MDKLKSDLSRMLHDPVTVRRLYAVTLATALFVLVLVVKGPEEQGKLVTDRGGNVTEIQRKTLSSSERYDVTVSINDGNRHIERDATLTFSAAEEEGMSERIPVNKADSREAELDGEIDRMLTEVEFSGGEHIELPSVLPDGTKVTWKARKQEDRTGLIFIPFIYICLVLAIIKSWMDDSSDVDATARREIMKGLPRFCNQLFLMMNAGMILSDAFEQICSSYMEYGKENMSVFESELTELCEENSDHRVSTATLISEYASRYNVKELIRIATILSENEKRGSDVIESLSRESKYLWDDRKIIARESGKMIDTRMSWPLALLLILLIVITMAPAMLNM